MSVLTDKLDAVNGRIKEEKSKELDRLTSSLAALILNERDSVLGEDEAEVTYHHKLAMVSWKAYRVALLYKLSQESGKDFRAQYYDDIKDVSNDLVWMEHSYKITDAEASDLADLFDIFGAIPADEVYQAIAYKRKKWSFGKKTFPQELSRILCDMIRFFISEGCEDTACDILEGMLQLSRRRSNQKDHRRLVVEVLAAWAGSLPEFMCLLCQKEAESFSHSHDEYGGDFLWFYGSILEQLGDMRNAQSLFERCYELRREIYGELNWYTALAKRESAFLRFFHERSTDAYDTLIEFVDHVELGTYASADENTAKVIQGKTLNLILNLQSEWKNLTVHDKYLRIYERVCEDYDHVGEPLINRRSSHNLRGTYYFKLGDYIQAEAEFISALQVEGTISISDTRLKSNLLMIYYVQNDLGKAFPLLDELLDLLERNDDALPAKDEYRIYTMMVSLMSQAMLDLDFEDIEFIKNALSDTCEEVLYSEAAFKDCEKEAACFMFNAALLLLQKECASKQELQLYTQALAKIETNRNTFSLDKLQQGLLCYVLSLLTWTLQDQRTQFYLSSALELVQSSYAPAATRAAINQTTAAYLVKHGHLEKGISLLENALDELTKAWQSHVRYLNDSRLIQILAPTQLLFSPCYAMLRKHTDVAPAYERLLQFKSLASLAGRERNRVIHSGIIDHVLMDRIRELQNRIAAFETESIFRDVSDTFEEDEQKLRELEKDFASRFPQNMEFTEITWAEVQKAIPDNSVVLEYFVGASDYGYMQFDPLPQDEEITVIDIYVTSKQNGICRLSRISVKDGERILEKSHSFVDAMQAISSNNATGGEMSNLDTLREELYAALVDPVLPFLQGQETIYIAPDNELVNLPIEILYDSDLVRLVDDYSIVKIESARDFLFNSPATPGTMGNLIIGNPAYELKERKVEKDSPKRPEETRSFGLDLANIKPLPYAELEAKRIAQRIKGKCAIGFEATKNLFLTAGNYENIHVATHGCYDLQEEANVLYSSSLLFSGVSNWIQTKTTSEFFGNGIVTADEISRLDLRTVKLVVLSSCMSGRSEVLTNKGFHGMIGALSAAGVQYVISHLWNASDFISTVILMDTFYFHYAEHNQSPPVALAQAQEYLRKITVGELRKKGWFDYAKQGKLNTEAMQNIKTLEGYADGVRPFKSEEYWGGFACYRCN